MPFCCCRGKNASAEKTPRKRRKCEATPKTDEGRCVKQTIAKVGLCGFPSTPPLAERKASAAHCFQYCKALLYKPILLARWDNTIKVVQLHLKHLVITMLLRLC